MLQRSFIALFIGSMSPEGLWIGFETRSAVSSRPASATGRFLLLHCMTNANLSDTERLCLAIENKWISSATVGRRRGAHINLWINSCPYPENGISPTTLVVGFRGIERSIQPCCDILLPMELTLAHIGPRLGGSFSSKGGFDSLTQVYLERCSAFARCRTEAFRSQEA